MKQTTIALLVAFGTFLTNVATAQEITPTSQSADAVIQWNRILLEIVRVPPAPDAKPSTVHPTRSFAIMHAAIYNAVNAIEKTHSDYLFSVKAPKDSSPEAAVATAGHDTLLKLYPNEQQMLRARLQESLAQIPDSPSKTRGIKLGQEVAQRILELRKGDGSEAEPAPFVAGSKPGDYQKTPPKFGEPVFSHWSKVKPFTLQGAKKFRPGPPPELNSVAYATAFQEVKELGAKESATRTPDQTVAAKFWSGKIQNYWNEIAQTTAISNNNSLSENARLFALLNLTFADGVIAYYDAKYSYNFWRPVTAIQAAETDNNPESAADPNWVPLADSPPDPAYPGAHSVISASGAAILAFFYGSDEASFSVKSEVVPGVERSFSSFSAAAAEAGMSRTYIGHHYRFDDTAGQKLGRETAGYVFKEFLTR
ncbi:MAG TPA: vanadium-dependent haloperoxidase [Chthoniobacterales bacterium]|nr:vanadium-dependent haloperoxidase [Chthoniobacterales bacterium]